MLTVGMPGLSAAQGRTEFGMWAISGAPLLAGNNLATMSAETAAILKNREVIAVDQDPRGLQGVKVAEDAAGSGLPQSSCGQRETRGAAAQPDVVGGDDDRALGRPRPHAGLGEGPQPLGRQGHRQLRHRTA